MNLPELKRIVVLVIGLCLILIALKPVPSPKAQAQRIHGVNHVANITINLANTNGWSVPNSNK